MKRYKVIKGLDVCVETETETEAEGTSKEKVWTNTLTERSD